ncbi:MAG: hypothetical protein JW705_08435 [Methanosarcinaceae archaeon]|nr:hypothetical protein [Methanosarcinaceae archaeon]
MIRLAFSMAVFGVIVCPKCREHAQIIELAGAKRTRCQKCGSSLVISKLRLFMTSDDLEEAVSTRTFLQARLYGREQDLEAVFSETPSKEAMDREAVGSGVRTKDFTDRRKPAVHTRDKHLLILDLLRSGGGKMDAVSLKCLAGEHGIEGQRFEQILEKLVLNGEVYEPSAGIICLV